MCTSSKLYVLLFCQSYTVFRDDGEIQHVIWSYYSKSARVLKKDQTFVSHESIDGMHQL